MADKKPLNIVLSQEELIVLLRLMGAPSILGLGPQYFPGLEESEVNLLLGSAERSLIARQFLSLNDSGEIVIDRVVLALLGPCAFPEKSIIITLSANTDTPEAVYYHMLGDFHTEHQFLGNGLHQFTALPETEMLLEQMAAQLQIGNQAQAIEGIAELTAAEFGSVLETLRDNNLEAPKPLAEHSQDVQDLLKSGLSDVETVGNIITIHHNSVPEDIEFESVTLMTGLLSLWKIDQRERPGGEERVYIASVTSEDVFSLLGELA